MYRMLIHQVNILTDYLPCRYLTEYLADTHFGDFGARVINLQSPIQSAFLLVFNRVAGKVEQSLANHAVNIFLDYCTVGDQIYSANSGFLLCKGKAKFWKCNIIKSFGIQVATSTLSLQLHQKVQRVLDEP